MAPRSIPFYSREGEFLYFIAHSIARVDKICLDREAKQEKIFFTAARKPADTFGFQFENVIIFIITINI